MIIRRPFATKHFFLPAGADRVRVRAEVTVSSPMMAFLVTETDGSVAPRMASQWPVVEPGEYREVEFRNVPAQMARGKFVLLPVMNEPEPRAHFRILIAEPEDGK